MAKTKEATQQVNLEKEAAKKAAQEAKRQKKLAVLQKHVDVIEQKHAAKVAKLEAKKQVLTKLQLRISIIRSVHSKEKDLQISTLHTKSTVLRRRLNCLLQTRFTIRQFI